MLRDVPCAAPSCCYRTIDGVSKVMRLQAHSSLDGTEALIKEVPFSARLA